MSEGESVAAARRVAEVRRFNRFYTRLLGLLRQGYVGSPLTLTEARLLYELAHQPGVTASQLVRQLDLDPGYLSRVLAALQRRGFLLRERDDQDARFHKLGLTEAGQAEFAEVDAFARGQIETLFEHVSPIDQERLVRAMRVIERLLDRSSSASDAPTDQVQLRPPQPGELGWVVARHGAIYAEEYGFTTQFEGLVAGIVAHFVEHHDPARERCWIAERDREPLGCIFLVKSSRTIAKLRLFLVEPAARGQGVGHQLINECLRFARAAGYARVRLWTQSILLAARHLYQQAGFVKIEEAPNHAFGHDLVSETWELVL